MLNLTPYRKHNNEAAMYNPFRELEDFERSIFAPDTLASFRTDIEDEGDKLVLSADLPGFDKDNVQAHLEDGYLTVTANKSSEQDEKNEKDQKGRYIRQERYSGSCSRSFYVGDIRPDEVKCSYESGVLRIRIPKRDMQLPEGRKQIAIE